MDVNKLTENELRELLAFRLGWEKLYSEHKQEWRWYEPTEDVWPDCDRQNYEAPPPLEDLCGSIMFQIETLPKSKMILFYLLEGGISKIEYKERDPNAHPDKIVYGDEQL
jgi:hypothetical protein